MEREQKGRRKIEREKGNDRRYSKVGAKTEHAMTINVAKEANAPSVGDNRTCSNGRD